MTHNISLAEEASMLTRELERAHKRLKEDPDLARLVPFSISQRGERDRKKLAQIFEYQGPDEDTMYLLQSQAEEWYRDPYLFWCQPPLDGFVGVDPHVQLLSRVLQLRHAGV